MIGGEGVTVELDESMFGRHKYYRGYLRPGQWVFGGVARCSGCCFLVPVETRDAKTVQGLIAEWVRPETRIINDCWAGYRKLADDARFTHLTVNHKLHFVDANTGAHTNTVDPPYANKSANGKTYTRIHRMSMGTHSPGGTSWRKRRPLSPLDLAGRKPLPPAELSQYKRLWADQHTLSRAPRPPILSHNSSSLGQRTVSVL
ncbi:hypothetical protein ISCGN_001065 [Ixodes scapularis]